MKKEYWLLNTLVLVKIILPFLLQNPVYEPHRDEFLYLAEGRHMAWGYMEVPPLLSLFAWLTNLFGGGQFWIKLWPSLGGAATYYLVGRLILQQGGKSFAVILGWLPFVFSGWLRVHFLFQPNFLELFFCTAMAYGLIRYHSTGVNKWLYWAGMCMGLGMMSKYSVAFYGLALLLGLLLTRERKILTNKHFYYAAAISLLVFLPNLIWQWRHGFPVIYHMQELQRNQLQYVDSASFLRDQLLMYLPCLLIWITGLGWLWFHQAGKPYRFIAWAYVALILLLLLEHGKGYYSMGAYPPLFAFGALRLEAWMWQRRLFLRYVLLGHMILLGYFSVPLLLPFLPPPQLADYYARHRTAKLGLLKWEDGENHSLPQDFADMLSWKEMTAKTAHAYSLLDDAEKSHTLLFCDNYGQAGALNYYGPRYHLPAAYSDNASFLYWLPADFFRFDNILLLTDDRQELKHPFIHEFRQAILVDSVSNPYAREYGSFIILLKGPDSIFRKEFVEKIQEDLRKTAPRSR